MRDENLYLILSKTNIFWESKEEMLEIERVKKKIDLVNEKFPFFEATCVNH